MITKEIIEQNPSLQGLADEQIEAIVTLSKNDEEKSFSEKFGKIHSELDELIKSVTGKGKETNEKTSSYLRRTLDTQISAIHDLTAKKEEMQKTLADLEEKVKAGSADKDILVQKDATIASLTEKYKKLQETAKSAETEYQSKLTEYRISSEIGNAISGLAFKEDINPQVLEMVKGKAVANVMGMKPSYITDASGKETLVFHTESGAEMRNDKNALNLYTAKELVMEQLSTFGVLADGSGNGGAGGGQVTPKSVVGLTSAANKVEAYSMMEKMLFEKGLSRGTIEFQNGMDALYQENAELLAQLPTR